MNERIQPERRDQILSPQEIADIKLALAEYEEDEELRKQQLERDEAAAARQRRREKLLALREQTPESSDASDDSERAIIVGDESHDLSLLSQADRDEYLRIRSAPESDQAYWSSDSQTLNSMLDGTPNEEVPAATVDPRYSRLAVPFDSTIHNESPSLTERLKLPSVSKRGVMYGMGSVGVAAVLASGAFVVSNVDNPESAVSNLPIIGAEFNKTERFKQDIFTQCTTDALSDDAIINTSIGNASADMIWNIPGTDASFGPSKPDGDDLRYTRVSFENGMMDLAVCEDDKTAITIEESTVYVDTSKLTLQAEFGFASAGSEPIPTAVLESTAEAEVISEAASDMLQEQTRDEGLSDTAIDHLLFEVVDKINADEVTSDSIEEATKAEVATMVRAELKEQWPEKTYEVIVDGEMTDIAPVGISKRDVSEFELDTVTLSSLDKEQLEA